MGKQTIFGVARDDRSSVYGIVLKKEKGAGMLEQDPPPQKKETVTLTTPLLVCYTAVFRVVTQRSSPLCGEERFVTTLKIAV